MFEACSAQLPNPSFHPTSSCGLHISHHFSAFYLNSTSCAYMYHILLLSIKSTSTCGLHISYPSYYLKPISVDVPSPYRSYTSYAKHIYFFTGLGTQICVEGTWCFLIVWDFLYQDFFSFHGKTLEMNVSTKIEAKLCSEFQANTTNFICKNHFGQILGRIVLQQNNTFVLIKQVYLFRT